MYRPLEPARVCRRLEPAHVDALLAQAAAASSAADAASEAAAQNLQQPLDQAATLVPGFRGRRWTKRHASAADAAAAARTPTVLPDD